ncbi:MAG: FAD-dependent oxidoreductase [Candidatus Geothermarchaeales archaeon]
MRIVIIGGGSAGKSAAMTARKYDRDAEITILEEGRIPAYSKCGLPYVLSKTIRNREDLILHPTRFYDRVMKVDLKLETIAFKIDPKDRIVYAESKDGDRLSISFDKIIYATGSRPIWLDLPGSDLDGIYTFNNYYDPERISEWIERGVNSAVVVGASFSGLGVVEALRNLDINMTIVEKRGSPLPAMLDSDMGLYVKKAIEENGVRILLNTTVMGFTGSKRVEGVVTDRGNLSADMVIMAVGVRPNNELASEAGLEIGVTGGIRVNERMETNVNNIYAAGDAAEYVDGVCGFPLKPGLADVAVRMGEVAGKNAVGLEEKMLGILDNSTMVVWDLETASVGYTLEAAARWGVDAIFGKAVSQSKGEYFPGKKDIVGKLIVERGTGRVIGGQCIGEGASLRINLIALAIMKRVTVKELRDLETNYAPPLTPENDVFRVASAICLRRKNSIKT